MGHFSVAAQKIPRILLLGEGILCMKEALEISSKSQKAAKIAPGSLMQIFRRIQAIICSILNCT